MMAHDIPSNHEAEISLLGAMFATRKAYDAVSDVLKEHHFYDGRLGEIYAASSELFNAGKIANPVTLSGRFDRGLLVEIAGATVTVINAKNYGAVIVEAYRGRVLLELAGELSEAILNGMPSRTAQEIHEKALFELEDNAQVGGAFHVSRFVDEFMDGLEQARKSDGIVGVPTGFQDIDHKLGGLHDSDLVILAARPSMGKTALAVNIGVYAAGKGFPTVIISLEMSGERLTAREIASRSALTTGHMDSGHVSQAQLDSVQRAGNEVRELPLYIDERAGMNIQQIRTSVRRSIQQHDVKFVIVDYLQLVREKGHNEVNEITKVSMGLKNIAKEFGVPVLALSQLSRNLEGRDDKRPQLSDLRGSGSIEQDADVVAFLYREEYYHDRTKPDGTDDAKLGKWQMKKEIVANCAEFIIAKNRNGAIGKIDLWFDGPKTQFRSKSNVG